MRTAAGSWWEEATGSRAFWTAKAAWSWHAHRNQSRSPPRDSVPEGDRFAYAVGGGTIRLCDRQGAEIATTRCGGEPRRLAFSAAGDKLLVACGGPNVQMFHSTDGSLATTIAGPPSSIVTVDSSAQGQIATGDDRGRIAIWENDQPLRTIALRGGGAVSETRFSPDGRWLAAIDSDRCMSLVSMVGESEPMYLEPGHDTASLSWSSDSANVAVGTFGGDLRIWDTAGKKISEARPGRSRLRIVCWPPGKPNVWVAPEDATIHRWHTTDQQLERTIFLLTDGSTAILKPCGQLLAAPASFQDEVVYGLETLEGGLELLRPQEFHQRHQLRYPPP